ncbi:MAG: glycerol-3-phosphate 1-O-acyltransferase PlsY [Defluviitaleaceae bacterium]|nr:glycerol-3-phosphate 1-O-acyltransferase PlsY [Defluviitaleaceae bacterium]
MAQWVYDLPTWAYIAFFVLIGYPFGALQSAYFIAKVFGKINIKEHGSGNAGATNVYRVMGIRPGLCVLVFDILKTITPIIIINAFMYSGRIWDISAAEYIPGLLVGVGVFMGHCFPFFLKFNGGKGVACAIGILIMFDPIILAIVLGICILIVLATRYISLASSTGFISLGIVTTTLYTEYPTIISIAWVLAVVGVFNHRKNIKWLLSGEEKRFNFKGGSKKA